MVRVLLQCTMLAVRGAGMHRSNRMGWLPCRARCPHQKRERGVVKKRDREAENTAENTAQTHTHIYRERDGGGILVSALLAVPDTLHQALSLLRVE